MSKEFIPYEIAIELRDLGFDMICLGSYTDKYDFNVGGYFYKSFPSDESFCIAPLWQQAFKWLRTKYGYISVINSTEIYAGESSGYRFTYGFWKLNDIDNSYEADKSLLGYLTYEEAELECLKEIIKTIKNENKRTNL